MSQASLLETEPPHQLMMQKKPGLTDGAGIPLHALELVRFVVGRLAPANANQVQAWASLGVACNYEIYTQDQEIYNGQFLLSADNRLFRVTSTHGLSYQKGNIQTALSYALLEDRLT